MREGTRNLLVGVFLVLAFGALGVLMMLFGEAPSWLGGSEWTLRITDVQKLTGISAGSPIQLNGVEIGRVQGLEFVNSDRPGQGVVIVCGIKNTYSVPSGAVANLYTAALGLGAGHIEIDVAADSKAAPIDREMASIPGRMKSIIGELISKDLVSSFESAIKNFNGFAEAAEPAAENFADLLAKRSVADVSRPGAEADGVTANVATAVERFDDLLANLNKVFGDPTVQTDLKGSVEKIAESLEAFRDAFAAIKTQVERSGDNLNDGFDKVEAKTELAFAKLDASLENLDETTTSLARIMRRIENGEGSAGRFVRDERLYEAGVLSLQRIAELVASVQRIVNKAESDGYIAIGERTALGTVAVPVSIGRVTAEIIEKLAKSDEEASGPLTAVTD